MCGAVTSGAFIPQVGDCTMHSQGSPSAEGTPQDNSSAA